MPGKLYRFMAEDHARLESLLNRAAARPDAIDQFAYAEFRAGLLRHIAMEEKILLPAAQRVRGGEPLPMAAKLRLDHAALAALLVPTPTHTIVRAIRAILKAHNPLEEGSGGVYEACEQLAGNEADGILDKLRSAPEVAMAPHMDSAKVIEATRRAVARAGYHLEL